MAKYAVTTEDNPYNPITDFINWFNYDTAKGYHTSEYLARLVHQSDALTQSINDKDLESAIDEMVKLQIGPSKYIKVIG